MTWGKKHIGDRRKSAWWEPMFSPQLHGKLTPHNWDFSKQVGCKEAFLGSEALRNVANDGEVKKFVGLTFDDCDIQGLFEHRPAISFQKCRFRGCDFAFSEWIRVEFKQCDFENCSFALATFEDCEFRECKWKNLGIQGSKTDFIRTFITNPTDLLVAGYSGLRPGAESDKVHISEQHYRLERTKAHLSRNILFSHRDVGDNHTYYQSAKMHDFQQVWENVSRNMHFIKFGGSWNWMRIFLLPIYFIELVVLWSLGLTNKWGESLSRPVLILFVAFIIFSIAYMYIPVLHVGENPWKRSFDISILAGYGNHNEKSYGIVVKIVHAMQLIVSIILYSVFFSTAVSRNGRSR